MEKVFLPSLLISEIFYPVIDKQGVTADIIEQLVIEEFYHSFEIVSGQNKSERKKILKLSEENNLLITQWLTFSIEKNGYDIASYDTKLREESINYIKESIPLGAESGAENIAFVPGSDSGSDFREESKKMFFEGLCEICEEAKKYNMNILFEPLDRGVDKNRLIGPTSEAKKIINKVRTHFKNIGLAFDTAHAALNEENVKESIESIESEIYQIHFSNAVLDKGHEMFGDLHIPIGSPGFLNIKEIVTYLEKLKDIGIKAHKQIPIAIEARSNKHDNLHMVEKKNRDLLNKAINLAIN